MIRFRELKKNAKKSVKLNFSLTVITCLIGLFILSLYGGTTNALLNGIERIQNYYDNGHFMSNREVNYIASGLYKMEDIDYNELYDLSDEELKSRGYNEQAIEYIHSLNPLYEDKTDLVKRLKVRDGFIKPILNFASSDFKIIFQNIEAFSINAISDTMSFKVGSSIALGIVMMILLRMFFINVITVGYARFFLENSKYHKTKVGRNFLFFKKDYLNVCKVMALKTIKQFLWNFTIIGGIIKVFSYRLVPYIVAEDSSVSPREAIKLSKKLMRGYKWRAFLLELSFFGWNIIGDLVFGLVGVFFVNPYKECTYAEFYKAIIKERKNEKFYKQYLNGRTFADADLYIGEDKDFYPNSKSTQLDVANQNYKPLTLVALFFIFAFIGWCLEVGLFLLKTHMFVNRGTLFGPWLPIYGLGCVIILIVFTKTFLKKYISEPVLLFLNIMVICGILEYFTSWFLEMRTGLKYWDYAGHLLNINGRVCLENLCEFGLGGLICVYLFAPILNSLLEKVSTKFLTAVLSILMVLFIIDNIYVRIYPRTGYGITGTIIDEYGNVIDEKGNIIK